MIILEKSGVKANEKKTGRSKRSKNITDREKSCAKNEKKIMVRRSEWKVKIWWSRSDQAVYNITTHSNEKFRSEKVDKQRRRSTQNDGR